MYVTNHIDDCRGIIGIECDTVCSLILKNNGLSQFDLINLAGGVPCWNPYYFKCKIVLDGYDEPVFTVSVNSTEFLSSRTIDIRDNYIVNNSLEVYKTGQGIGRNLLINQIRTAREFGISHIEMLAAAGEKNGDYTWGRLGFTMDESELEKLEIICKAEGIPFTYLFDLLSTEEGQKIWKKHRYSWFGRFDLSKGSENIDLLTKYLKEKKLDISI